MGTFVPSLGIFHDSPLLLYVSDGDSMILLWLFGHFSPLSLCNGDVSDSFFGEISADSLGPGGGLDSSCDSGFIYVFFRVCVFDLDRSFGHLFYGQLRPADPERRLKKKEGDRSLATSARFVPHGTVAARRSARHSPK